MEYKGREIDNKGITTKQLADAMTKAAIYLKEDLKTIDKRLKKLEGKKKELKKKWK